MPPTDREALTDAELADRVEEAMYELEGEVRDRYDADHPDGVHPAQKPKYDSAMELVYALKEARDRLRGGHAPRYPWHPTEDDYRGGDDLRALDDLALIAMGERKGGEDRIASLREQLRRRLRAASTDAPSEEPDFVVRRDALAGIEGGADHAYLYRPGQAAYQRWLHDAEGGRREFAPVYVGQPAPSEEQADLPGRHGGVHRPGAASYTPQADRAPTDEAPEREGEPHEHLIRGLADAVLAGHEVYFDNMPMPRRREIARRLRQPDPAREGEQDG